LQDLFLDDCDVFFGVETCIDVVPYSFAIITTPIKYVVIYQNMAGVKGLEPSAFRVTGGRSNQLSYTPKRVVEHEGVEPTTS
jgi:hypothetical protein